MTINRDEIKHLRSLGHQLKPIVTVSENGLSEGVNAELDRALSDHELIKVKLAITDREARKQVVEQLCESQQAQAIQVIGKVVLLLRRAKKPNPKLSNLLRPLG